MYRILTWNTATHVNLTKCSEKIRKKEINSDIVALSERFGQKVNGFAYPYGIGSKQCRNILKNAGIQYARTVSSSQTYRFPSDPYAMPMSCWHISSKTFERLEEFFQTDPGEDDMFFLMFAHGYEFDFGTKESNWDKFERICETVATHKNVNACSIGEAFRMHEEK